MEALLYAHEGQGRLLFIKKFPMTGWKSQRRKSTRKKKKASAGGKTGEKPIITNNKK